MLLLESCLQTCMTYTIAECRVNKLLMMDRETVRKICRVSCQNKFVKLVHVVGFITKKFVTMHGYINSCRVGAYAPARKLSTNLYDIYHC